MSSITLQRYLDLHYGGDIGRVEVREIDYSTIRTESDLVAWAGQAFGIPSNRLPDSFKGLIEAVWKTIIAQRRDYVVLETTSPRRIPLNLRPMIKEMGDVLGFHLPRETLRQVAFLPKPKEMK